MRTSIKQKSSLFDPEFDELLSTCSPFMSEFLQAMVEKLMKGADDGSTTRQEELRDECLGFMANGLEFYITKISREIGPDPKSHVRRLRRIVDELITEAAKAGKAPP